MNQTLRRNIAIAILSALVIALQFLPIRFGVFQITLALIPIVIGGILYGPFAGGYLGFVMAMVILINGDAAAFLAIDPFVTFVIVIAKSTLAGFLCAIIYRAISKKNYTIATWVACLCAPLINTGIFALGCLTLFGNRLVETFGPVFNQTNLFALTFVGLIGVNFIVELLISALLSGAVVYIVRIIAKRFNIGVNE